MLADPDQQNILNKLKGRGKSRGSHRRGEMNKTEAQYADRLQILKSAGDIADFKFESVTFRLADRTRYTPDFMVMLPCGLIEFHEVKAFWVKSGKAGWTEDSRVKIKVAAEMFPFTFKAATLENGAWHFEVFGND